MAVWSSTIIDSAMMERVNQRISESSSPFMRVLDVWNQSEGETLRRMCRRVRGCAGSKEWRRLQRYRKRTGDRSPISYGISIRVITISPAAPKLSELLARS